MAQKLKDDGECRAPTYSSVWYRHPSHHSTWFQVTVLLFWSSHPPLATPLWSMKLNWVMFSDFYHRIMVCLLSQRLLNNEMILKVSDFCTPYHSKHLLNVGMISPKIDRQRYLTNLLITSWSTDLNNATDSINLGFPLNKVIPGQGVFFFP